MTPKYSPHDVYIIGTEKCVGQIRLWAGVFDWQFDAIGLTDFYNIADCDEAAQLLGKPFFNSDDKGICTISVGGYTMFRLVPTELSQLGLAPEERAPGCPTCGHPGEFVRAALMCPTHKTLIGGF